MIRSKLSAFGLPAAPLKNSTAPRFVSFELIEFDLYLKYSGWSITKIQRGCCSIQKSWAALGLDMRFLGGKRKK